MEVPAPVGLPVGTKVTLCNYNHKWRDLNDCEGVVQGVVMEGGSVHRYLVQITKWATPGHKTLKEKRPLRVPPENLF